jgi:hypothetical protein
MNTLKAVLVALPVALLALNSAAADSREGEGATPFEGAIVIRPGAPIYAESKGGEVSRHLSRGDAVAITMFRARTWYDEVDGRVEVLFFLNPGGNGVPAGGWMNPKDLSKFTYYGPCQRFQWGAVRAGAAHPTDWDACFRKARDKALDALP